MMDEMSAWRTDGRTNGWMDGRCEGQKKGRKEEWMVGLKEGRV